MNWYVGTDWSVIPVGGNSLRQVFVKREDCEAIAAELVESQRALSVCSKGFDAMCKRALAAESRISELESQDEIHWKTRRSLLAERDRLAAELAGCKQQLALAPTYEKMIAHNGSQERRIAALEAALREAKEIVKAFHDMGSPKHMREEMWDLYQQSPEMKRLNAALTPQETPIAQSKSQQKRFEAQGVAHVPFPEGTAEDEDRCSNMGHKRYRMFGCTECLDQEATSIEPIKGGQLCHLCNAVHDLMSACPPKETGGGELTQCDGEDSYE